jgi:hypothetical protein
VRRFELGDIVAGVPFVYYGCVEDGLPLDFPPQLGEGDGPEGEGNAPVGARTLEVVEWEPPDGDSYAIVTSQSCDLHEEGHPQQPWFQVCPVRKLSDDFQGKTLPGFMYRIAPPNLPPGEWAADLRIEVAVEKTFLVGKEPIKGFADESSLVDFADALGRRRDRAALATPLVDAVGGSLRQLRRNNTGFKNMLRREVYSVRLRIEAGSRSQPTSVRLHVFARGAVTENMRERFGDWWDSARGACEAIGITLLPTQLHDGETDLDAYEAAIPLDLG